MLSRIRERFLPGPCSRADLRADVLAGLTVGVIALPLSMALAIAAGTPPQHGLYTAIVGGAVIALSGGSRVNISGPTAAFVVILLPITAQYGIGGLLLSGLMAGLILVAMGAAGLGSLIRLVPYPVTVGFTAGIAVVIATLQLRDFLGLQTADPGHGYVQTVLALATGLPTARWPEFLTGTITLAVLIAWQQRRSRVPAHLVALVAGTLAAFVLSRLFPELSVETIGSRFSFVVDGVSGHGIPPIPPRWAWPWQLPDATGAPIGVTPELLSSLLGSAFAIAMLGALESLLCATVADGMTGTRHDPNRELIGQGIGNLLIPFFGGIPATAALARTAANVRAGGRSPVAAVVHSVFLFAALLALAPVLAWVPMASMAALLLVVAWNMSELRHFRRILRVAPRSDIATLLSCFGLTVLVNMEVAVAVGMGLAALLFIRRTIELTGARMMARKDHPHTASLPDSVVLYDVNGPLFFGAAQKALDGLTRLHGDIRVVILDMSDVTMIDMTAIVAMESIIDNLRVRGIGLIICSLEPRIILKLRRAGVRKQAGVIEFARDIEEASRLAGQRIAHAPVSAAP
jgi:SulP family sulfate permease